MGLKEIKKYLFPLFDSEKNLIIQNRTNPLHICYLKHSTPLSIFFK